MVDPNRFVVVADGRPGPRLWAYWIDTNGSERPEEAGFFDGVAKGLWLGDLIYLVRYEGDALEGDVVAYGTLFVVHRLTPRVELLRMTL